MKWETHVLFENIDLVDTGLINTDSYSDFIGFCLRNNIFNLIQLFNYIEKYDININTEILGIVSLLKYKYFYTSYEKINLLNLSVTKYENINCLKDIFFNLGFISKEIDIIIDIINDVSYKFTIGELMMFLEQKFIVDKKEDYVLKNKISLLATCYRDTFNISNNMSNSFVSYNILKKDNGVDTNKKTRLDVIKLEDCNFIGNKNYSIYDYAKKYGCITLGDLVKTIENEIKISSNKEFEAERKGLVDLINYKYNNKKLSNEDLLYIKINFYIDKFKGKYYKGKNEIEVNTELELYPLRRLGFTSKESEIIKDFVLKSKRSMTIIEAIYNYKIALRKPMLDNQFQKVLNNKIDIIIDYYIKRMKNHTEKKKIEIIELSLFKYINLFNKNEKIELEKKQLEDKIYKNSENISNNDTIKLIKRYMSCMN